MFPPVVISAPGLRQARQSRCSAGKGDDPMYAVVRTYEMSEDWDDKLRWHLTEQFIPALEKLPGFVSYQAMEADTRLFCSVTVFEDRAGADASNRLAAEYVQ